MLHQQKMFSKACPIKTPTGSPNPMETHKGGGLEEVAEVNRGENRTRKTKSHLRGMTLGVCVFPGVANNKKKKQYTTK